jgi:hypothetical protein
MQIDVLIDWSKNIPEIEPITDIKSFMEPIKEISLKSHNLEGYYSQLVKKFQYYGALDL